MARRVLTCQVGALLRDQRLRAHDDAGRAEPALEGAGRREDPRVAIALLGGHAFEGRDRATRGLGERRLAAHLRLAVEQDRAAPALPRGRAPVLRREDAELIAQRGEQMGMVGTARHRGAVEHEGDRFGADHPSLGSVTGWNGPRARRARSQGSRHTRPPRSSATTPGSDPGLRRTGPRPRSDGPPPRAARRGSDHTTQQGARPRPRRTPARASRTRSIASFERCCSHKHERLVERHRREVCGAVREAYARASAKWSSAASRSPALARSTPRSLSQTPASRS